MSADPWTGSTFGAEALAWSPGLDWQSEGVCRSVDPALFHTDRPGEVARVNQAKRICRGQPDKGIEPCPVLDTCLTWALEIGDNHAVLGGTSPKQRQRMRTEQRRANGGRVRCRICRRLYIAAAPQAMDCSDACRLVSRRQREARRRTQ